MMGARKPSVSSDLDAAEMGRARRARIGVAIRNGQEAGEIATKVGDTPG